MLEEAPLQSNFDQAVREYYVPSTNDGDGIRPVVQMVKDVNSAPWGAGVPTWVRDATANDSDKTFTVPAGKMWDVQSILGEITATATVGNRLLQIVINCGLGIISVGQTTSIGASQRGGYLIAPTFSNLSVVFPDLNVAGAANTVGRSTFMPRTILPAGGSIRVWDAAAIDAAADDLTVVLHYIEYDA